jgi:F-type H+-transporting ATPase subunit a
VVTFDALKDIFHSKLYNIVNTVTKLFFAISFLAFCFTQNANAQEHTTEAPVEGQHVAANQHIENPCESHGEHKTDYTDMMIHHIGNSNELEVVPGVFTLPLPVILKDENGFQFVMSSAFHADGENAMAHNGYVLNHGVINRIKGDFPKEDTPVMIAHGHEGAVVCYNGQSYALEGSKNLMQDSSFYDFSISKNVFTMMLGILLLGFIFIRLANYYKGNSQKAPSGLNAALEAMVVFVRDEIAKPMIGKRYYEFLPLLLTFFFFILVNNLFGLIPFAPFGANVTGNISTTLVLAVIAFIVTNINGTKDYWGHIFWMPGVPVPIKIFLAPIEFLGVFIKPVSLMIRLFANITAGHIIIMSLVGLIFIFGNMGESLPGAFAGGVMAVPFTLFLSIIELVVAFIQAFIFTMLTASYFGAAVEEHHHEKAH